MTSNDLWDANDACRYTTKTSDKIRGNDVILDLLFLSFQCADAICIP